MTRLWFARDVETVATFWRVLRRDGVTLGFTTHDRDLWFDGVCHSAGPGMVPSAIRHTAGLDPDSAEVTGALAHAAIRGEDLAGGRFDGAGAIIGLIDWETLERHVLWRGTIGAVREEDGRFAAELASRKADLLVDPVPRTSPACRAAFCGPGCALSAARFTHEAVVVSSDPVAGTVRLAAPAAPAALAGGIVRWLDGPDAGATLAILATSGADLLLDGPAGAIPPGSRALVREGCDHTLDTCATRFANAVNFQGEPFLPGNDFVTRTAAPQ